MSLFDDVPPIPYIEPIPSTSRTNLNKYIPKAFAKTKTHIFNDEPPPFYDPAAIYENSFQDKPRMDLPSNEKYEEQYFNMDFLDSEYSIISSGTYTIDSGSTYTLR